MGANSTNTRLLAVLALFTFFFYYILLHYYTKLLLANSSFTFVFNYCTSQQQQQHPIDGQLDGKTRATPSHHIQVDLLLDEFPFNDMPMKVFYELGFPIHDDNDARSVKNNKNNGVPMLEVVVMPHSHIDPSYADVFEAVYESTLRRVLSSSVAYLTKNKDVTFEVAEISILEMWWRNHGLEEREAFVRLVENGQLELLTGGWVMPDEANTHYYGLVMQLLEGHEWLRNHLPGVRHATPTNHWNIDSFGLSPTMAYLLREAGLKHGVMLRTMWSLKSQLAVARALEFRWRQTWENSHFPHGGSPSPSSDFLVHLLPLYGFHVSESCGLDPFVCCEYDFARIGEKCLGGWNGSVSAINERNVAERSNTLAVQLRKKAQLFKENVIFIPWGEDNRYASEEEWSAQHHNLLRLFNHINSRSRDYNMHVGFGTLREYFDLKLKRLALSPHNRDDHGESSGSSYGSGGGSSTTNENHQHAPEAHFPTLSGDFFPYAHWSNSYWTGYFTTRPFHKHMARTMENLMRTADILFTAVNMRSSPHQNRHMVEGVSERKKSSRGELESVGVEEEEEEEKDNSVLSLYPQLVEARRTVGLMQHHDSIAGTTKAHIMEDYAQRMLAAINTNLLIISRATSYLLSVGSHVDLETEKTSNRMRRDATSNHTTRSSIATSERLSQHPERGKVSEKVSNPSGTEVPLASPITAEWEFSRVALPRQRVITPKSDLILFNPLAFEREEVVCILVPVLMRRSAKGGEKNSDEVLAVYEYKGLEEGGEVKKEANSKGKWAPLPLQQVQPMVELTNGMLVLAGDKQKLCFLARLPALGFRRLYLGYNDNNFSRKNTTKAAKLQQSARKSKKSGAIKLLYRGDAINLGDAAKHFAIVERIKEEKGTADLSDMSAKHSMAQPSPISIANEHVSIELGHRSGLLRGITSTSAQSSLSHDRSRDGSSLPKHSASLGVDLSFVYYGVAPPNIGQRSGLYIFRPDGPARPLPSNFNSHTSSFNSSDDSTNSLLPSSSFIIIDGPVQKSVVVKPADGYHLVHTLELNANSDAPTIHNRIDLSANHHQDEVEVAMRLRTSPEMSDFHTELNAYQFIRRKRRLGKLPIEAHYFPMPGAVFTQGGGRRLSLLGRQPLGTASLEPGWMEVMLDRRLTGDDHHGFGQGLVDNRLTESSFRLILEELNTPGNKKQGEHGGIDQESTPETPAYPSSKAFRASLQLQHPVMVQYVKRDAPPWLTSPGTKEGPVEKSLMMEGGPTLPCGLHLVTLRTLSAPTQYSGNNNNSKLNDVRATATPADVKAKNSSAHFTKFTSLRTEPRRAAALVLHRAGLVESFRFIPPLKNVEERGGYKQQCVLLQPNAGEGGGGTAFIPVNSLFAAAAAAGEMEPPKRVAEASLTLLSVAEMGMKGGNVSELALDPMEIRSWLVEF